jgi:putative aminopeptidase FrvX
MSAARAFQLPLSLVASALALLLASLLVLPACRSIGGGGVSVDDESAAFEVLEPLVEARGVSGHERPVRDALRARLLRLDPAWNPEIDPAGNLVLTLGSGERTLLFVAHMDEIGLQVKAIRPDGLLECDKLGGLHDHLFQATAIELVTTGGVLPGIALPPPPEVEAGAEPRAPFLLDVGARNADEAEAIGVAVGDVATVPKELQRLGAHRAAGRSNDDRVGCAALLLALARIDVEHLDRRLVFVWSVREETGLEGADVAARTLRPVPETVFAVDTLVTSDSPREDPRFADVPLGGGPVLRALDNSSMTPRDALDRVRAIAHRHSLPLQTAVMGGGNDGSRWVPEGVIDCPLAWPQRNSHSRVETMDLRDLVDLAMLVAAVAQEY